MLGPVGAQRKPSVGRARFYLRGRGVLQTLLAPKPLHPLVVDLPALPHHQAASWWAGLVMVFLTLG